jgi:hypothetical protein
MDMSYLKSRTIVNVEAAANFGGGWMLRLEDGEVIKIGGDLVLEKAHSSPTPETPTLKYDELTSALGNAYSYALKLAAGLIEFNDPFQWLPGWENRDKRNPSDLADLLRESAKRFEARSRSYQNYVHDVAHASAAIMLLMHMDNSDAYYDLEDTCSGFPGLWELSARAGRALTDALYEVADPDAERHEFVDLIDVMAGHIIKNGADLPYNDLLAIARTLVTPPEE